MPSECWLYTSIGSTTTPRKSSAFSALFSNYLESSVPPVPIRSRFCSKDQTPPRSLKRWRCCSSISITKSPACLTVVRPSPSTCSTLTRSPHLLTFYYRSSELSLATFPLKIQKMPQTAPALPGKRCPDWRLSRGTLEVEWEGDSEICFRLGVREGVQESGVSAE